MKKMLLLLFFVGAAVAATDVSVRDGESVDAANDTIQCDNSHCPWCHENVQTCADCDENQNLDEEQMKKCPLCRKFNCALLGYSAESEDEELEHRIEDN